MIVDCCPSVCVNKSHVQQVVLGIDLWSEDNQKMFQILRIDVQEAVQYTALDSKCYLKIIKRKSDWQLWLGTCFHKSDHIQDEFECLHRWLVWGHKEWSALDHVEDSTYFLCLTASTTISWSSISALLWFTHCGWSPWTWAPEPTPLCHLA